MAQTYIKDKLEGERMSLSSVSEDFMQRQQGKKGKLRVFFGFAAGVGKTYAMLLEARELFALGDRKSVV